MLKFILFLLPFILWFFSKFILFGNVIELTKENYVNFIATLFSGLSIFFTVEGDGKFKPNTLLFYILALISEFTYITYIEYRRNEYDEYKFTVFMILLFSIFINSNRLVYQIRHQYFDGAFSLLIFLLILIIKFINK